jgi:triosephosphate isomerase
MRIPIAAANWKMNYGPAQATSFAHSLRDSLSAVSGVENVLFPPFISLSAVHSVISGTTIQLGAQNVADHTSGAYTGEVAPGMISELCSWVILGHSERRSYYGETDEIVNGKTILALQTGLRPIVCVGERLAERQANQTNVVITTQVRGSLANLPIDQISKLVIAYEPVWAIGTGLAASRQDADAAISLIRSLVGEMYNAEVAENIRILYGGSVTATNVAEFAASPQIDGALVGGASLKPEFLDISKAFAAAKA